MFTTYRLQWGPASATDNLKDHEVRFREKRMLSLGNSEYLSDFSPHKKYYLNIPADELWHQY